MSDAKIAARLRSDPHDPLAMRALVRAGKAPPIWRLLASLGHERYQGLGLRRVKHFGWVAVRLLGGERQLQFAEELAGRQLRSSISAVHGLTPEALLLSWRRWAMVTAGLGVEAMRAEVKRHNRRAAAYILGEAP